MKRTHTVRAIGQSNTLSYRRGVIIALVRAASDKEVAASPALQALRDQVIGLEHVQVLAE